MVPLVSLSRDDIREASLLQPTGVEHGTSPTPEEEAILLGKEVELPEAPGSLPECMEIPEPVQPTKQTDAPSPSPPPSPLPQPCCLPSWKTKKSWQEVETDPSHAGKWVCFYMQKNERVPKWWWELQSLICSKDECFSDVLVKGLAC